MRAGVPKRFVLGSDRSHGGFEYRGEVVEFEDVETGARGAAERSQNRQAQHVFVVHHAGTGGREDVPGPVRPPGEIRQGRLRGGGRGALRQPVGARFSAGVLETGRTEER